MGKMENCSSNDGEFFISDPSLFPEYLPEDMVKSSVVSGTTLDDRANIIDVFRIDNKIDTSVKGRHIIHGAESITD